MSDVVAQMPEPPQRIVPAYEWDGQAGPNPWDRNQAWGQTEATDRTAFVPSIREANSAGLPQAFPAEVVQAGPPPGHVYVDDTAFARGPQPQPGWYWQVLPDGLIFHNYMAGVHEPRISGVAFRDRTETSYLDVTLGGRVGVLRLGTDGDQPEGWQLDLEGAAFPRLNLSENWDVDATDFRFGVPLTYGNRQWQTKFSYYHLSSHLGDELAIRDPTTLPARINYSRDALTLAISYYLNPALRTYAEADWAFHYDDGNLPWEFQFGIDYAQPCRTGIWGTPFFALNGHLREAVDFGGNLVVQAGWLWRGQSSRTLRAGFQYYNGKSNQFEFFDRFEEQVGFGIWYDQ